VRRPAFSLRQASAAFRQGTFALEVGKQFIRWGKADILNPTDRFAPRDFLEVTDDEFLAVAGARVQYERAAHLIDAVFLPYFTPSRIPLLDRRWGSAAAHVLAGSAGVDFARTFRSRSQYGARWNVLAPGFEFSISYFDGLNHFPQFILEAVPSAIPNLVALPVLARTHAHLRMAGADAAVPLRWFSLKGEAASLFSVDGTADDVVLYVVQVERQAGELSLVAGYAGETVTARRTVADFAPDRGLTRAFLGRVAYTIDATRDVALETAIRQNLKGVWLKGQFSKAFGVHWRVALAGAAIGGDRTDFIGQYDRNSHLLLTLRYSF
jgi:hypothetical protein